MQRKKSWVRMYEPSKNRFMLISICYFLPVVILGGIWFPVINHYYVPNVVITDKVLDRARSIPDDHLLDQINDSNKQKNEAARMQLIDEAEAILKGEIKLSGFKTKNIAMPFSVDDIDKGLPAWQLALARLRIPDILLDAYDASGREEFLAMARDVILAWASYERRALLPKGFLWNDHAIADRIPVLIKFWRHYRNNPNYKPEVAKHILQMVTRSARLLAKPSHFTFSTNHGIMQNLALLEITLAFPSLLSVASYKQIAVNRLHDQMSFILNEEGVILEHSAGYHESVLFQLGKMFRYLTMSNLSIPEDWIAKYKKGIEFYAQIMRPDGSLPMYGDTSSRKNHNLLVFNMLDSSRQSVLLACEKECTTKQPSNLYPVAGYSIWWGGLDKWSNEEKLNQTLVAWSFFPGHAHKHADEMTVLIWAGGNNWWTNAGYWPYGMKGRSLAISWAGSNAPHLISEPTHSIRQTRLLSYGWLDTLAAIDLERKGPGEYVARRQVIHVKPNLWIVLDHTFGNKDQRTTTTWTTSSHINLSKGETPGSYILEPEDSNVKLTKFILTSEGANIRQFKGSFAPFAGWDITKPASAVAIEQPADNSWAAAIWLLQESDEESLDFNGTPFMEDWKNPENWQIALPFSSNVMKIWRDGDRVFVLKDAEEPIIRRKLQLSEPPQIENEIAGIHTAYENAARKYPSKKYSMHRHLKSTYLLFFIFLLQEAFFLVYTKIRGKYYTILRGMSAFGWIAVGAFVFVIYL